MKRNSIYSLVFLLGIAGAISYAIIWWRNRPSTASTGSATVPAGTGTGTTPVVKISANNTGLPALNSYAWWLQKLGRASFPLGKGSVGVEVYKVQEELNNLLVKRNITAGAITEDGIFGAKTEGRLTLLFPGFTQVTQYMFITEFDKEGKIL